MTSYNISIKLHSGSWICIHPSVDTLEEILFERNIAYRVCRRKKTTLDRERYKAQRKQVNYLKREAKRLYMKRYLDSNLPTKTLWWNLDSDYDRKRVNFILTNWTGQHETEGRKTRRVRTNLLLVTPLIYTTSIQRFSSNQIKCNRIGWRAA
jgi:hypothetical protein